MKSIIYYTLLCIQLIPFAYAQKQKPTNNLPPAQNTLIVSTYTSSISIDPHIATSAYESIIINALFEGLCANAAKEDGKSYPE